MPRKPRKDHTAAPPETAVLSTETVPGTTPAPPAPPDGAGAEQRVRPDTSGRYPDKHKLSDTDLLHAIDPKPFPSRITEPAGDHLIHMVDYGNAVGYGVKIEGEKPSPGVLAPLKEQREFNGRPKDGLKWAPQAKEWGKRPSGNYVGDRLEIEGRHAVAVKAAREEAAARSR